MSEKNPTTSPHTKIMQPLTSTYLPTYLWDNTKKSRSLSTKKNHATFRKINHATWVNGKNYATSPHTKIMQPLNTQNQATSQQKNNHTTSLVSEWKNHTTSAHKKIMQPLKKVREWVSEWKNHATSSHKKSSNLSTKRNLSTQKGCNLKKITQP